jgi:hypothetical protein
MDPDDSWRAYLRRLVSQRWKIVAWAVVWGDCFHDRNDHTALFH